MNKQQLANKIWESANRMRSKIEANEYKDYILGFIFYKFLSDKEVEFLKKDGYEDDDIKENAHENNESLVDYTLEVPSFARKLSKVKKASPIFKLGISKEAIVEFTKNTPELAGKFKYSEDGTQIRLGTKKSKIAFLKLMNDAFLHSELTKQWYDASAKDNITQGAG